MTRDLTKWLAFTLAEVLITLAIIGVVAALTIPTLVQNYKKRAVETKLLKIYSVMNQAIKLSTVDNGETNTWDVCMDTSTPYENVLAWFNKYFAPYIKYTKVKQQENSQSLLVYFLDGTALSISNYVRDIAFVVEPKCLDNNNCQYGKNMFNFRFQPKYCSEAQKTDTYMKYVVSPGFEPYTYGWDGTIEGAKQVNPQLMPVPYGCYDVGDDNTGLYCTKLIQLNNWKIPDDYPYKF